MNKSLLTAVAIAASSISGIAFADCAPKLTIGGHVDVQGGGVQQQEFFRYEKPAAFSGTAPAFAHNSNKLNTFSIVNDTKINVGLEGHTSYLSGMKYGAKVVLFADASKAKQEYNQTSGNLAMKTFIFMEGEFGKVELGSTTGATKTMQVGAQTFARATGGIDGDARYWWNPRAFRTEMLDPIGNTSNTKASPRSSQVFLESANMPTNEIGRYGIRAMNAAKISYYTPNFHGFTMGASYTPDMQSYGTIGNSQSVTQTTTLNGGMVGNSLNNGRMFRQVFEGGVHYENMFNDVGIKAAVLGQTGLAKKTLDGVTAKQNYKDLRAWEAGLNLSYKGFTIGGSYGDWQRSGNAIFTNLNADGTGAGTTAGITSKTNYFTVGGAYEYGPFGVSLTYMDSKNGYDIVAANTATTNNRFKLLSLGADYKMAPGFMPYVEISSFVMKDNLPGEAPVTSSISDEPPASATKSNKGFVFLAGAKVEF